MICIFFLIIFFNICSGKLNKIETGFDRVINYGSQAIDIANDIKILMVPEININDYLSIIETIKRDEINLNDFLARYSLKNSNFEAINFKNKKEIKTASRVVAGIFSFGLSEAGKALNENAIDSSPIRRGYFDLYDKIKDIFKKYNIKISFDKDKKNRWYQIDQVINGVERSLLEIKKIRVRERINEAINIMRQQIIEIFLNYQEELIFLEEIFRVLVKSENNVKNVASSREEFFSDIDNKKIFNFKEDPLLEFYILNFHISFINILEYQNIIYKEKKNKLIEFKKELFEKFSEAKNLFAMKNQLFQSKMIVPSMYEIKQPGMNNKKIQKVGLMLSQEIV